MTTFLLTILYSYVLALGRGLRQQQQRWLALIRTRLFLLAAVGFVLFPVFSYVIVFHQADDQLIVRPHLMMADPQSTAAASANHSPSLRDDGAGADGAVPSGDAGRLNVQQQQQAAGNSQHNNATRPSSSSFKSPCSLGADLRGPHQKVIGYSIYGDFSQTDKAERYLTPLMETVKDIASAYPGWIVRIHHNLQRKTRSWKMLERAVDSASSYVDLCNVTEIVANNRQLLLGKAYLNPMTWRWLPVLDGLVDTFMSRDADSVILPREQDAVAEWLASNYTFHIMRDNPCHCIFMLGGLWGVKLAGDHRRRSITKAFEQLFKKEKHVNQYNFDQRLLTKCIWPVAKSSHMAHDSYCCQKFNGSRPFPTQRSRQLTFVGAVKQKNQTVKSPCPKPCRPINANPQPWNYC